MSRLGTRDNQRISKGASQNDTRRKQSFDSRDSVSRSTAIGFTANATVYDTGRTMAGIGVGEVVRVFGSPLNSRTYEVITYTAGSAEVPAVAATGTITFAANPSNDATITLNGTVVTFKTEAGAFPEVQIGASLAATLATLLSGLQGSADAQLVKFQYSVTSPVLYLTATTAGTAGNSLTIAASAATVSAATLTGGAATVAAVNRSFTVLPAFVTTEAAGAAITVERV